MYSAPVQTWLEAFIQHHGATSGTVHLRKNGGNLELFAHVRIPPPVLSVIAHIPRGKGMAGLAWERNAPVSTCNLKTDTTGDVRPGAKAVNAQAAVALPVHHNGQVVGVVGIAFSEEKELSGDDLALLQSEAELVPFSG